MKTITFYSYKGGVGRTLALANIAKRLSEFGKKVCLIDFDLEAPGLHHKFKDNISNEGINNGLVDYINDFNNNGSLPKSLSKYVTPITFNNNKYKDIDFIAAGNVYSDKYWKILFSIDWINLFYKRDSKGVALFVALKESIKKELKPDYLLIDSRTGISEISGITMSLMADEIVLLAAKNDENILGLKQIIKSLSLPENTFSGKLPKLNFVLCRIPYFDRPEEKSIEQGAINEVARDLKEFVKEFNLTFEFEKLFIIHSDPTLEIEEKLLMGYQYEKEEGNKQFIQRKFRLKSPIATDYLDLFEELTKGKLSAKEKLIFNNIKKSEFLIERVQSISDNNKKIELLLEAIDLNQRSDEAHSLLAKTYFSTGDHEKALEIINKAIELNLESSDYLCTKAIILGKLGKEEDAEDLFNQVLKRDNKNFLALSNLGTIFYTKKEYEKALDCYSSVVRLYPDYAIGYNEVGNIFRAQKKYEEAFKYIYKALELKPRDSMSTGTLAEIYAQLGNDNEFYKNFELCLMFTKNRKNILSYIESEDVYKPYLKVPRFLNLLKKYNIDMDICK